MSRETDLLYDERDLLLTKIGDLDLQIAAAQIIEEARTGSMGGHDPDFYKLNGGLIKFWREKVATHPHPFTYCVRHLRKHVANPERLCAWLRDQATGTTMWRSKKGRLNESGELVEWEPSIEELREAHAAFEEALSDLNDTDGGSSGARTPTDEGEPNDDAPASSGDGEPEGSEAGGSSASDDAEASAPEGSDEEE